MTDKTDVRLSIRKEKLNSYNENFDATMENVYSSTILLHQIYARLGYQIKVQEQILDELKKLNGGK